MSGHFLGPWALLAFLLLVAAAAAAICGTRVRSACDAFVGIATWSAALVISFATVLSVVRALTGAGLLALAAAGAAAAWTWRLRRQAPSGDLRTSPVSPARSEAWWIVPAAPVALFAIGMALAIGSGSETGADNLAYHLPRLGYWQQQRAVAPFVAGNVRAGSFPPNGNVLQLPPVVFLGHDRFCGIVQLAASILTAAAVHGIARALGATAFAASMAALCWFAIPCMLEQAGRSLVDVTASFFVAAAAFFLARRPRDAYGPIATLACAAIAAGVKTQTLVLAGPLAAVALWRLGRDHPRRLAQAAVVGPIAWLALGGAYSLACARVWSDPTGLASVRWVVSYPSIASLAKNAALVALPVRELLRPSSASLPRAPWSALTGEGYGAGWLALSALTGLLLLASVLRRERAAGGWAALWALGTGGALVLCFALRHQPAVLRFLLPAAALVTPTFAWTFDRLGGSGARRFALATIALLGVGVMLWRWTGRERAARRRDGRALSRSERFGPDLQPLALAIGTLDRPSGARLGLLTPDYFPEGVFFGRGYRNRLVPLSYQPPQDLDAIERLSLDALWVDTRDGCTIVLFRRDFERPGSRPQRNREARADSYDEDFAQAYGESVYRVDLKPTLRALADPRSTWGVWQSAPRGALFVQGRGRRADLKELCGEP